MVQIFDNSMSPITKKIIDKDMSEGFEGMFANIANERRQSQANQLMQRENQAFKELTGMDISGIQDPNMRKEAFKQAFSAKQDTDFLEKIKRMNEPSEERQTEFTEDVPIKSSKKPSGKGIQELSDEQLVALHGSKRMKPIAQAETSRRKVLARNQPIPPEQMDLIHAVRNQEGFDDLDEIGQYRAYIDANVSPDYAEREAKLRTPSLDRKRKEFDTSYDLQKEFIEDTTQAYKGFETEMKPRLRQMVKLGEGEGDAKLIEPAAAAFLEFAGVPLGVLDNPSNELYHKLSQDLLKGLPETYGTRILKVEVENFLKTIPQLVNSANGRRMIASNMLKLGEMKEAYYREMRNQQQHYLSNQKPLPKDFQEQIFDNVKPQIDRITNEFIKLAEIKSVPKGTVPFFNPQGEVSFVPNNPQAMEWAEQNGGRRIW
jgi:hypothetical protein